MLTFIHIDTAVKNGLLIQNNFYNYNYATGERYKIEIRYTLPETLCKDIVKYKQI